MTGPSYVVGDAVIVTALNAEGIIVGQLSKDLYRVAIRSMHLTVKHSELIPVKKSKCRVVASSTHYPSVDIPVSGRSKIHDSIDLHGLTVDEATRALESWLNASIVAKAKRGKVIHGLGTGRVQQAVHNLLGRYAAVRKFRINAANPGETEVYFE